MNKVDNDYLRSAEFVRLLFARLRLSAREIWQPNTPRDETGADVGVTLADEGRIGIQVTEVDPFPIPGTRGREKKQRVAASNGVYGDFTQNDSDASLSAIYRAIERKTRITPNRKKFQEVWLLLCTGVPDAPASTFIPTAPLSSDDLNSKTGTQLTISDYDRCFVLPVLSTENTVYTWSKLDLAGWSKIVYLPGVDIGTGDAEFARQLIQTQGRDEGIIEAQVERVLAEVRAATPSR